MSATTPTISHIPELMEMALAHLPYADLLAARLLSRTTKHLIDTSPTLQRNLFRRAAKDTEILLLLGRSGCSRLPEHIRPFPGLFEAFGVDSKVVDVVSAAAGGGDDGKETAKQQQQQQHLGPQARFVRLHPFLTEPGGRLKELWKYAVGRETGGRRDVATLIRLEDFIHQHRGPGAMTTQLMMHRRDYPKVREQRMQLWHMYLSLSDDAPQESDDSGKLEDVAVAAPFEAWAGTLLSQPPAWAVVFAVWIAAKSRKGKVDCREFVRRVVVPEGVRWGHLVRALSERERAAVREAGIVETTLFLEGVVADRGVGGGDGVQDVGQGNMGRGGRKRKAS